jgi:hypothetical protein
MDFALGDDSNKSEVAAAANYPQIRLFTVGQCFFSPSPLPSLRSIEQGWVAASPHSVARGGMFGVFSAVAWFFGRQIADANPGVPIGLIASTRGGSPIAEWVAGGQKACGGKLTKQGHYFNTQIAPFTVGPTALSGFIWYQAEADTKDEVSARAYACTFPALIKGWRAAFKRPEEKDEKFFGFVQLSTWCATPPQSLAQMRAAQMVALSLPRVGYSTNADHGAGCYIHPHNKRPCGTRLGDAALGIVYNRSAVRWRSPSYLSASASSGGGGAAGGALVVTVALQDAHTLELRPALNMFPDSGNTTLTADGPNRTIDLAHCCPSPAAAATAAACQCGWGAVNVAGRGWLNASISVQGSAMLLTVKPSEQPAAATASGGGGGRVEQVPVVLGTAYGWSSIPMLTVYDSRSGLPVLPWNSSWNATTTSELAGGITR